MKTYVLTHRQLYLVSFRFQKGLLYFYQQLRRPIAGVASTPQINGEMAPWTRRVGWFVNGYLSSAYSMHWLPVACMAGHTLIDFWVSNKIVDEMISMLYAEAKRRIETLERFESDKPIECPICKEEFTEGSKTHCGHVFHNECIVKWYSENDTCPMCRSNIPEEDEE